MTEKIPVHDIKSFEEILFLACKAGASALVCCAESNELYACDEQGKTLLMYKVAKKPVPGLKKIIKALFADDAIYDGTFAKALVNYGFSILYDNRDGGMILCKSGIFVHIFTNDDVKISLNDGVRKYELLLFVGVLA